jgi:hypothetical protein
MFSGSECFFSELSMCVMVCNDNNKLDFIVGKELIGLTIVLDVRKIDSAVGSFWRRGWVRRGFGSL